MINFKNENLNKSYDIEIINDISFSFIADFDPTPDDLSPTAGQSYASALTNTARLPVTSEQFSSSANLAPLTELTITESLEGS